MLLARQRRPALTYRPIATSVALYPHSLAQSKGGLRQNYKSPLGGWKFELQALVELCGCVVHSLLLFVRRRQCLLRGATVSGAARSSSGGGA